MKRLNILLAGSLLLTGVADVNAFDFDTKNITNKIIEACTNLKSNGTKTFTNLKTDGVNAWEQAKTVGFVGLGITVGAIKGLAVVSPFLLPTMLSNAFSAPTAAGILFGCAPIPATLLLRANLDSIQGYELQNVTAGAVASSIMLGIAAHRIWKNKSKTKSNNVLVQILSLPSNIFYRLMMLQGNNNNEVKNKKYWKIGALVTGALTAGVVYTAANKAGLNWIYVAKETTKNS